LYTLRGWRSGQRDKGEGEGDRRDL
jgi:hypothetical protein